MTEFLNRLGEFTANHPLLVAAFVGLWVLFFLMESRRSGQVLSPQEATNKVNREGAVIVDLRDDDDFRQGHIAGSLNIPSAKLSDRLSELKEWKDKPVILVCRLGTHSGAAARILKMAGHTQIGRMRGGIESWRGEKLPLVKA